MTVFGAGYAAAYDALYGDKDYAAECDLVERLAREWARTPTVERILDLGCGTGGHATLLAERGYEVVGVDRSEEMLALARAKAGPGASFVHGDVRDVAVDGRFDVALLMFAVLGYLRSDADVAAALANARRHLRPGGLLVFDVWYAPAVLAERPSERVKEVPAAGGRIVRRSAGELDEERRLCVVRFHLVDERSGERREVDEEHVMRYFSRPELEELLHEAGFEVARIGAFPDVDREPDESTWSVVVAAVAV